MLRVIDNVLYRDVVRRGSRRFQLMASVELRNLVLEAVHDDLGHLCIDRILNFVADSVFWVGVWIDVKEYYKICKRCAISNLISRIINDMTRPLMI